jgi:hypothetical protein
MPKLTMPTYAGGQTVSSGAAVDNKQHSQASNRSFQVGYLDSGLSSHSGSLSIAMGFRRPLNFTFKVNVSEAELH